MKTDILITQAQKIPEIETELFWYLDKYKDLTEHPWEKYLKTLYTDFNIMLPSAIDPASKVLLIGLTIITCQYKLFEGNVAGSYRILVRENCLSTIKNPTQRIIELFTELVSRYYKAFEFNSLNEFEEGIEESVHDWNIHPYFIEDRIHSVLKDGVDIISESIQIKKDDIPRALNNYNTRIDEKCLQNLKEFEAKVKYLLRESDVNNNQARFIQFILDEIANGGKELHSVNDLLPQYSGIKFS